MMGWYIFAGVIVLLTYAFIYSLCKVASDADAHIDIILDEMREENDS